MTEQPLTGGRLTPGVVRIGDTVRRPAGPHSPFVAALLQWLAERGFDGAPRHLGSDDQGRDVLSYLVGDVPARFRTWADAQVRAAAALLRDFHDATFGSRLAEPYPVVCHHDPGPNNVVFRAGVPVAFIDFDFAAPGDPLEDVAYLAWTWCVVVGPRRPEGAGGGGVDLARARVHRQPSPQLHGCSRRRRRRAAMTSRSGGTTTPAAAMRRRASRRVRRMPTSPIAHITY
ncbi:hypothetical protein C1I92_05350 [Jiangella anatolica]|uniref:Aminoglycoside phosphotransferase domain-containing protein n=1 Tax=Jiangella anatolica TaxID=2670374 RepID=A0A2W2BH02_9ACTN|nr:aminoglycoside phosphotransferase family protein [Jiangella anatolica]PZF85272.1 hypothetical protein C1I92_05350 [Jiangella anatolica]